MPDHCECSGPGWCERHQIEKHEQWWRLCQRGGGYWRAWEAGKGPGQRIPAGPGEKKRVEIPSSSRRAKAITKAYVRWQNAGFPVRSDSEIKRLFETVCKPCEYFEPHRSRSDRGRCLLCGCRVNLKSLNKLKWATEECPDLPPRFYATVDAQGNPVTPPLSAAEAEPLSHEQMLSKRRRARIAKRRRRRARRRSGEKPGAD